MKLNDHNITIMVKDMDESINFYQGIGLALKQRWDNHYAMMTGGGVTLGIHPGGTGEGSGGVSIGFMIDDFDKAKAHLDTIGIPYKAENDGSSGNYLHFKDPDGTVVYYVLPKW